MLVKKLKLNLCIRQSYIKKNLEIYYYDKQKNIIPKKALDINFISSNEAFF